MSITRFTIYHRFVKVRLVYFGTEAAFRIRTPWGGWYGSLDEVRGAINAQFDN